MYDTSTANKSNNEKHIVQIGQLNSSFFMKEEAIEIRLEAIAIRLEAIASRLDNYFPYLPVIFFGIYVFEDCLVCPL